MKSVGIVRKLDQLGRVVLPKELRDIFGLADNAPLAIYVDNESIVLKKYEPDCIFCGDTNNIKTFNGKKICSKCINNLY